MKVWFGSYRRMLVLMGILLASRAADFTTTYLFLSKLGWDLSFEWNAWSRFLFQHIGFFAAVAVSIVGILLTVTIAAGFVWKVGNIFYGPARARRGVIAMFLLPSAFFLFVSLWNLQVPLGIALPSFPEGMTLYAVLAMGILVWVSLKAP